MRSKEGEVSALALGVIAGWLLGGWLGAVVGLCVVVWLLG